MHASGGSQLNKLHSSHVPALSCSSNLVQDSSDADVSDLQGGTLPIAAIPWMQSWPRCVVCSEPLSL